MWIADATIPAVTSRGTLWLLLLVTTTVGCATLPDVSPFASASRQLAGAMKAGGSAVSEDLHATTGLETRAKQFDQAWAARNDVMRAVVAYSDGLVAIVRSTGEARDSARALADKVGALAQVAGVAQPGAGTAGAVASDTAAFIWAQIALVRGAASLGEALTMAQPVIDRLTELITTDNRDLASIVRGAAIAQRTALDAAYNEPFGYAGTLARRRTMLRAKGYGELSKDEIAELARIDELMVPANAQLQKREEQLLRIDRRERASLQLIAATRDAMERWAAAHRDVALAIQERKAVSVESLTDATIELRELVKRMREL